MSILNSTCKEIIESYKPQTVEIYAYVHYDDRHRGYTEIKKGEFPIIIYPCQTDFGQSPLRVAITSESVDCMHKSQDQIEIRSGSSTIPNYVDDDPRDFRSTSATIYQWSILNKDQLCTKGYLLDLPVSMTMSQLHDIAIADGHYDIEMDAPIVLYHIHNLHYGPGGAGDIYNEDNVYDVTLYRPERYKTPDVNTKLMRDHLILKLSIGRGWSKELMNDIISYNDKEDK